MRILVAVRGHGLQAAVAAALAPDGHALTQVEDGVEALEAYRTQEPELVLTALDLPRAGGLELARVVRLASRQRFVPVLMFTLGVRPEAFKACLEAGVMEFIASPFEAEELRCRVDTLARLVRLQRHLLEFQARNAEELALVKHMLTRITGQDRRDGAPGFHMETLQDHRINGDAWVHREALPGVHFGMICDATGHGLMAGVSTIPVVMTFLAMVDRDIPLATIYLEIHAKLKALLPTGHFACLLLLRLEVAQGVLSVLNAGLPDVHVLRRDGSIQTFASAVLPAGIRGVDPGVAVTEVAVAPGDRIFAFSDGLGDRTTPEELRTRYLAGPGRASHREHCEAIRLRVASLASGEGAGDDLTWALWEVPAPPNLATPAPAAVPAVLVPAFEAEFRLDPRVHGLRDVLPRVLSLVMGFPVDHGQAQIFSMLLMEALNNAVDHGLLGLDSALKARGFEVYEQHRRLALASPGTDTVRFRITLLHADGVPGGTIRRIRAEVEDPGPGFDWRPWLQGPEPGLLPFGRGIALLRGLGRDLSFNEAGNRVAFSIDCL